MEHVLACARFGGILLVQTSKNSFLTFLVVVVKRDGEERKRTGVDNVTIMWF